MPALLDRIDQIKVLSNKMKWFKSRNNQIITAVVVILLLVSGYLLFAGKSKPKSEPITQDQSVQQISAEELGLEMEANPAKNEVKFSISNTKDIKSIDYELAYEADASAADVAEGGEERVQRGVQGQAEFKPGESTFESEWLVLGSESAGTKRYDTGVESVDLTLKIVKSDGKTYQAEKSLEL